MGVTFQVVAGTIHLQADFMRPAFYMLASPAPLFDRLWTHLSKFGAQLDDLSVNQGANLGGTNLQCTLRTIGIDFKLYANRAEMTCLNVPKTPWRDFAEVTTAALGALREEDPEPVLATYSLTIALHGTLDGMTPQAFVGQYTIAPQGAWHSRLRGSGAIFYYGNSLEQLSGSLQLDLSAWHDNAVFIRAYFQYDAATMALETLPTMARQHLLLAAQQLGLAIDNFALEG